MNGSRSLARQARSATVRILLTVALVSLALPVRGGAQSLPVVAPKQVGLSADRLARIRPALEAEIAKGTIPGAVVIVARKGKVAYFESFGLQDKATGRPMSKDAIFRIYSMTKPIVSVAALMLMEEGTIRLTDPVSKWVPAFAKMQVSVRKVDPGTGGVTYATEAAERPMTVHDLLRHTSGLVYPDWTSSPTVKESYVKAGIGPDADFEALTTAEFSDRLSKVLLAHQPGAAWEYGLSHDLLGRVIEAASGKRLGDLLAERIFRPLGMVDTAFFVSPGKVSRLAQPRPPDPADGKPAAMIDVTRPPSNEMGGRGAVSTAADYLRFAQMLLNGGRLGDTRLLSRTSVALLTADHIGSRPTAPFSPGEAMGGIEGAGYGLGVGVRLLPGRGAVAGSVGEYSWIGAGGTSFLVDPTDQLAVVYLAQTRDLSVLGLVKQVVSQAIAD